MHCTTRAIISDRKWENLKFSEKLFEHCVTKLHETSLSVSDAHCFLGLLGQRRGLLISILERYCHEDRPVSIRVLVASLVRPCDDEMRRNSTFLETLIALLSDDDSDVREMAVDSIRPVYGDYGCSYLMKVILSELKDLKSNKLDFSFLGDSHGKREKDQTLFRKEKTNSHRDMGYIRWLAK